MRRIKSLFRRDNSENGSHKKSPHIWSLKDALSVILLFIFCTFAVVQKMEILAILTLAGIGAVIYKHRVLMFFDVVVEFAQHANVAKVGDLELAVNKQKTDLSKLFELEIDWMRAVVSQLNSEHIGLLISVHKAGKYRPRQGEKNNLRVLRSRGLLKQNAPTMLQSTTVWLSNLGSEIAEALITSSKKESGSEVE